MSTINKDDLRAFVIKLRKKQADIEQKRIFCHDHNFFLEFESLGAQANLISRIISDIQSEFNLGFVWDHSLDNI